MGMYIHIEDRKYFNVPFVNVNYIHEQFVRPAHGAKRQRYAGEGSRAASQARIWSLRRPLLPLADSRKVNKQTTSATSYFNNIELRWTTLSTSQYTTTTRRQLDESVST
jgi:hypothetical protein